MRSMLTAMLLFLLLGASAAAETLTFNSALRENLGSIRDNSPPTTTIEAKLSLPAVAHKVPAVILLHTCIGPYSFDEAVGAHLRNEGYATLEFDSLKPRGWTPADSCGGKIPAGPWTQLGDAYAALKVLARHSAIDPDRIAVIGGSMGGGSAFLAASEYIRTKLADGARFAAHVGFYPSGSNLIYGPGAFTKAPILLMLGERDDWTPPKRLIAAIDFLKKTDAAIPVTVKTFDAFHSWIGSAARSYQATRKSFADCPYVMMQIDDDSIRNTMLSVSGELTPIASKDIGEIYRQCRTNGATTEGSRVATEASLAELSRFLKAVFAR